MTQREIDHIRKRERWREIIARQKESGLSVRAFCRTEGLRDKAFKYWKNVIMAETLRDAAMLGALKAPPLLDGAKEAVQTAEEIAFRPADVPGPSVALPCDANKLERLVLDAIKRGDISSNRATVLLCNTCWRTANKAVRWLEAKGIVKRYVRCKPCEVLITRDQWEAMKDQLMTTDKTVADLLPKSEEPAAQEAVSAPEAEPAPGHTYIEKLDKLYPKPTAEKGNDGKSNLAVVSSGVTYDVVKKHLYVSGDASDETIKTIAKLLKELGY